MALRLARMSKYGPGRVNSQAQNNLDLRQGSAIKSQPKVCQVSEKTTVLIVFHSYPAILYTPYYLNSRSMD